MVYVGFTKNVVDRKLKRLSDDRKELKYYTKGEALIFISDIIDSPMELIFLFKNDTCYYQECIVYCSPCADKFTADILKDKNYKFRHIDGASYVSFVNPKIVMRIGTNKKDTTSCNVIKINMNSKPAF